MNKLKLIILKRCCSITMQRRRHIGPDGKLKQQTNSVSFWFSQLMGSYSFSYGSDMILRPDGDDRDGMIYEYYGGLGIPDVTNGHV